MKYIDKDFYDSDYGGTPIPDDKFDAIANAAERVIDQATHYRLGQLDFSTQIPFIQQQVKMAISAQIEYFYELGSHTEAGFQNVHNASLGGFSYTESDADKNASSLMRSKVAMDYLAQTGLTYAGVHVRGIPFTPRIGAIWRDYYIY